MATIVQLGASSPEELTALERISEQLPDDYFLTTSAWGVEGRQLDSVLICPHGIMNLELKHWRGTVRPRHYGPWTRDHGVEEHAGENPYEQAESGSKKLASYLRIRLQTRRLPARVDYLILLTHPSVILDLADESLTVQDRSHVAVLRNTVTAIEGVLRHVHKLDAQQILTILTLLKFPGLTIKEIGDRHLSDSYIRRNVSEQASTESSRLRQVLEIEALRADVTRLTKGSQFNERIAALQEIGDIRNDIYKS